MIDKRIGRRNPATLWARRLGIDTHQETVIYMRQDCPVCRSEGFASLTRVRVALNGRSIVATLNIVTGDLLANGEAGLSESAWQALDAVPGAPLLISHPEPVESLGHVRAKVYGKRLDAPAMLQIIRDIVARKYADSHIAAFVTACADDRLDVQEMIDLTRAMIDTGEKLDWRRPVVADKHCVGGLPGNRTTPIVVPILAACGLTIPKTSSRAITSPAGTADTLETLTRVTLTVDEMRKVVEKENGCLVWGGSVQLSPADDILIQVERALDLDGVGQLVASVLSKKVAAGSTHVVVDIPVGPTAKLRSQEAARELENFLMLVSASVGLKLAVVFTDGTQPVGRGMGPALEAIDVLAVLKRDSNAPLDLRDRSLTLAGRLLELTAAAPQGAGYAQAAEILDSGAAWKKFQAICEAQGGLREPPRAQYRQEILAAHTGTVLNIDNRQLARVAKLAGAPQAPAAGLVLHTPVNTVITAGQPLYTVHAESAGELAYALEYARAHPMTIQVGEPV